MMHRVGLATFVSGGGLYLVLASHFHVGGSLHLTRPNIRYQIGKTTSRARKTTSRTRNGWNLFAAVKGPIRRVFATYRAWPARVRWGHNNGSVTHLQSIFLEEPQPSGPIQEGVRHFVATRQATSYPIAVSRWGRDRIRFWEVDGR
jgi:hypothetical protein